MKTINKAALKTLMANLEETSSTFHVSFTKANGEHREMDCGFKVTKDLKGGKATYNGVNNDKGNYCVWERTRNAKGQFSDGQRRSFNIDRVISIKFAGEIYKVV